MPGKTGMPLKSNKMKKLLTPVLLVLALLASFNVFSIPKLNSFPTASATIFLDFDGHYVTSPVWNGGTPLNCTPANMLDGQITEVFNRVSEDYRPFNINITTDSAIFLAAPMNKRMRVIITTTSAWYTGVGGVSYVGSFTWGDDTPCFVFCDRLGNSPKMVAECCSHESGHSVGLSHQSKYDGSCNLTAVYNDGLGSGQTSWAPIMGNSYYRNMSGWNNGPTPYGCANTQDNLSIITSSNGFSYRTDDYNNDINSSPTNITISNLSIDGVIATATDKDAFKFSVAENSNFVLKLKPYSVGNNDDGANLDVRMQLFDGSKNLVRTYDPSTTMNISIDTILYAGDYYMLIDGAGNSNASDYGSLGSYSFSGAMGVLPIRKVSLTGKTERNKHSLNWSIIADDAIHSIVIESSTDGRNFTSLNSVTSTANNFTYTPFEKNNIYYRLKVVSSKNQAAYSNAVLLKSTGKVDKAFSVSTFIHNEISVNAATNFQYQLNDMNGNVIAKGNGSSGFNKVNMTTQANGVYILQLLSNNERQIERIIKQ